MENVVVAAPKVAVAVFILKEKKALLGRRRDCTGESYISVPSGHLEFGESFEECAAREVKEESGLDIENIEIFNVTNNFFLEEAKPAHFVVILVRATLVDANQVPGNMEPNKCDGWEWYDWDNLPQGLIPQFADAVKHGFNPFLDN